METPLSNEPRKKAPKKEDKSTVVLQSLYDECDYFLNDRNDTENKDPTSLDNKSCLDNITKYIKNSLIACGFPEIGEIGSTDKQEI
jgi:hypothetical protein